MKKWNISYSIGYRSGEVTEHESIIREKDITRALEKAIYTIKLPAERSEAVDKVVIWSVGIIDEDVF